MRTGHGSGAPLTGYLRDFPECQPEATGSRDERKHLQDFGRIDSIARLGPTGRRNDSAIFIQPQRLAAETAAPRDTADQQLVPGHEPRIDLAAWGKVKRYLQAGF